MKCITKAQVSLELMLVVAVSVLIISPLIYLLFSYESEMTKQVSESQIKELYNRIMNDAYEVHYASKYNKKTFFYRIPGDVESITAPDNSSIVFTVGRDTAQKNYTYYSRVPLKVQGFESKEVMNNVFVLIKDHGKNHTLLCSKGNCGD